MSEELAYIAGLVDSDGSIFIGKRSSGRYYLGINFTQTNRDTVEFVSEHWGVPVHTHARLPERKDMYITRLRGARAQAAIEEIYPYLIGKRKQADAALDFPSVSQGKTPNKYEQEDQEMLHQVMKGLNHA